VPGQDSQINGSKPREFSFQAAFSQFNGNRNSLIFQERISHSKQQHDTGTYSARVPNLNSPPAYLLRDGYHEGGTLKNRTLANITLSSCRVDGEWRRNLPVLPFGVIVSLAVQASGPDTLAVVCLFVVASQQGLPLKISKIIRKFVT
jgi:hypothetical protein